jgi:hypothetical protein
MVLYELCVLAECNTSLITLHALNLNLSKDERSGQH